MFDSKSKKYTAGRPELHKPTRYNEGKCNFIITIINKHISVTRNNTDE